MGLEHNIRYSIDRAREAQQQHEQKHDTQLEINEYECEGHPADEFHPMGETVYCDGSCRKYIKG